jgi:trans-aconitate methyltransferase
LRNEVPNARFSAVIGNRPELSPDGVFAVHMPAYDAMQNRLMREMAESERRRKCFPDRRAKEWRSHDLDLYYSTLPRCVKGFDLWATD